MSESAGFEATRAVADAILYEGYLLYPYRRSSAKNRMRWQFGVLAPRQCLSPAAQSDTSISGSADAWHQQTECLLEASESAQLHVRVRFLQLQQRAVQQRGPSGDFTTVDSLTADGEQYLTFDDAVAREHDIVAAVADLQRSDLDVEMCVPAETAVEWLPHDAGRIMRTTQTVSTRVRISVNRAAAPFSLWTLSVITENSDTATPADTTREQALYTSMIATHALIGVRGGSFLSLIDPPEWATPAAKACRNIHTFPVLAGDGTATAPDTLLSSPILLYDNPQVSPESPGDLFDAAEIDEILSLRTATLTEEEKAEARATDPRAAAIVDRVDELPREVMERLHGAVRSLRPHQPEPETVTVDGVRIRKGSRVRLHPRRKGTDAQDIFLSGRTALVEAVMVDVDGSHRIAVTVDDDPGADLHQWYGRFYYFNPEEIAPAESDGVRRPADQVGFDVESEVESDTVHPRGG